MTNNKTRSLQDTGSARKYCKCYIYANTVLLIKGHGNISPTENMNVKQIVVDGRKIAVVMMLTHSGFTPSPQHQDSLLNAYCPMRVLQGAHVTMCVCYRMHRL